MNTLDLILLAILLIFTLVDTFLGFVNVAITFGGLVLGILFAGILSDPLSNLITFTSDKTIAKGIAFVAIVLLFGIVAHVATLILGIIPFFGLINHVLGGVLGLVQGFLLCGVVIVGWALISPVQLQQSVVGKAMAKPLGNIAVAFAPTQFKDLVKQVTDRF